MQIIILSFLLSGCNIFSPVKPDFSSLNSLPDSSQSTTSNQGDLVWIDILSKDVVEAQVFYSALFGWQYTTNDTGYITIMDDGKAIGGMLLETHVDADSRWMPMFAVADSQQGGEKALEMLGHLPTPPANMTPDLTYAVISDIEGASFGIMSSPSGVYNEAYTTGKRVNAQLWSHDRQTAFRFYQPLFSLKVKHKSQTRKVTKKNATKKIADPIQTRPIQSESHQPASHQPELAQSKPVQPETTTMRRIFAPQTNQSTPASTSKTKSVQYKPVKPTFGIARPNIAPRVKFGVDLSMNIIELPWQDIPAQWVLIFNVSQPDAVLSQVVQNGGSIHIDFDDPLSDGSVAVIEDPSGAVFMIQSGSDSKDNSKGRR